MRASPPHSAPQNSLLPRFALFTPIYEASFACEFRSLKEQALAGAQRGSDG